MVVVVLLLPLAGGLVSGVAPWRRAIGWLGTATASGVLVAGVVLAIDVVHGRPVTALDGILRVDALSAFMVIVIGVIAVLATWQGVRYLEAEIAAGRCTRRHASLYSVLVQAFLATMLLAVLAANLGVLWVAVEATTVVTTFLVGHRRTRSSLEASWKYIVICSVGIAMAFLGTVLVYSGRAPRRARASPLDWTSLVAQSHQLDPGVHASGLCPHRARLWHQGRTGAHAQLAPRRPQPGTRPCLRPHVGGAPDRRFLRHPALQGHRRWRPRARRSPAPCSSSWACCRSLVAASLLLTQRDYKRMLAYHSVEHMGLIALGAAAGSPLGHRRGAPPRPGPRPGQGRAVPGIG